MIKNIIFDLDGTLLPMDQEKFIKAYFLLAHQTIKGLDMSFEEFYKMMYTSVYLMVKNDGKVTNEVILTNYFKEVFKDRCDEVLEGFVHFYQNEFNEVVKVCSPNPLAAEIVKELVSKGYKVILATNPVFPRVCTEARMKWAGLDVEDFCFVTTYENSSYCKPNLKYYEDIISKLGLKKEECLMVGNDTSEDYVITKLDIPCVILKDCLINKEKLEIDFSTLENFYHAVKNYPIIK